MITEEGFINTMNALADIYQKEVPSPSAQKTYFMIFQNNFNSDEELMSATYKVLQERVFPTFPKPSEFLEAGKRKDDLEGKIIKASLEIRAAIKKAGAYRNVCFEDPVIHACIKDLFGGWVKICTAEIEDFENAMKWDFPKIYKYHSNNKIKNIPIFLTGISSNSNESNGIEESFQIEYIGNEEKCKKWTELYFNKNNCELLNQKKYIQLGYKQQETLQIEQSKSPIKSVNELIEDLTEEFGSLKQVKKQLIGIEYTQGELLGMVKQIGKE